MENSRKLSIISYGFSVFSFLIFLYVFFCQGSSEKSLKEQALYWFYTSLFGALIPNVQVFKFKDLEIEFKKVNENIQALEKKVSEINQDIIVSLETIAEQESLLSDEDRDKREKVFQGYADRLKKLPLEERLKRQKKYTIQHLNKAEISIYDLKEMLKKLGFHQGEINNKFNEELAASISKFQEKYHVTPIDGTCGPKTLSKLREIIASD
jgi:hypothetical protein